MPTTISTLSVFHTQDFSGYWPVLQQRRVSRSLKQRNRIRPRQVWSTKIRFLSTKKGIVWNIIFQGNESPVDSTNQRKVRFWMRMSTAQEISFARCIQMHLMELPTSPTRTKQLFELPEKHSAMRSTRKNTPDHKENVVWTDGCIIAGRNRSLYISHCSK